MRTVVAAGPFELHRLGVPRKLFEQSLGFGQRCRRLLADDLGLNGGLHRHAEVEQEFTFLIERQRRRERLTVGDELRREPLRRYVVAERANQRVREPTKIAVVESREFIGRHPGLDRGPEPRGDRSPVATGDGRVEEPAVELAEARIDGELHRCAAAEGIGGGRVVEILDREGIDTRDRVASLGRLRVGLFQKLLVEHDRPVPFARKLGGPTGVVEEPGILREIHTQPLLGRGECQRGLRERDSLLNDRSHRRLRLRLDRLHHCNTTLFKRRRIARQGRCSPERGEDGDDRRRENRVSPAAAHGVTPDACPSSAASFRCASSRCSLAG